MADWSGRKAKFFPSLLVLIAPILVVLSIRWIGAEPYVIPSSSMVPTLLENDFILVNKSHYGMRVPFSRTWLLRWSKVERGDVIIFKYPVQPDTFFIKRVAAVGGDTIEVRNGRIFINGEPLQQEPAPVDIPDEILDADEFEGYTETNNGHSYTAIYSKSYGVARDFGPKKIPDGHFFVMGDNRDNSSDSRIWGTVPEENIMGRASLIWLSCKDDTGLNFFNCEATPYRATRMWRVIH